MIKPVSCSSDWWQFGRIALALVLLSAAGLKLLGAKDSALPALGWYGLPTVQFAAVAWEFLLAIWLLSGTRPIESWLAASVTFILFAGVSGSLAGAGVADCGCFGPVKTGPWVAFTIDALALTILAVARPAGVQTHLQTLVARPGTWAAVGGVMLAITGGLLVIQQAGSLGQLLAIVRDDPVIVTPVLSELGEVPAGETRQVPVTVTNRSARPLRLIGATSTYKCVVIGDLPVELSPGESRLMTVAVAFTGTPGLFEQTFGLFVADTGLRRLSGRVTARIVDGGPD